MNRPGRPLSPAKYPICAAIRAERLCQRVSIADLARKIGIPASIEYRYERDRVPSLAMFARIAKGLGVSPTALLKHAQRNK